MRTISRGPARKEEQVKEQRLCRGMSLNETTQRKPFQREDNIGHSGDRRELQGSV